MPNSLYADSSQAVDRHLESMMASLAHRLEVAKAANDFQLAKLLEREEQQLTSPATQRQQLRLTTWLNTCRQSIAALLGGSKPQVCQFVSGSDCWWYAIDPKTGQSVYADSKAELRLWIEKNY